MAERKIRFESGSNSDGLRIYIRDDASGVMLAGFTLDMQQAWDLLRGGTGHVDAQMTDHFDRVGKTMVNDSVTYTSDAFAGVDRNYQLSYAEDATRQDFPEWDEYDARRQGGGMNSVRVVMRRWE